SSAPQPDLMAVATALWRAAHLRRDAPPHVLEDDLGLRLVRDTDALATFLGPRAAVGPDAGVGQPFMGGSLVAGAPPWSPGRDLSRTSWRSRRTVRTVDAISM